MRPLRPCAWPGLHAQHLGVEKQQRRERLLVGVRRHFAFVGHPGEKSPVAHLTQMPHAMETDEGAYAMHINLFGLRAVVQISEAFAQLVEHLGGRVALPVFTAQ